MAAKKNLLADKAYELYQGGMKLVDIAAQLGCSSATIRTWKNRYQWDIDGSETKRKRSETKRDDSERELSWVSIEHEYVTDIRKKPCSLEGLAKKYSIPIDTLKDRCARDKWVDKRAEYARKTLQKVQEKSSDKDAERILRLLQIADIAADKAEQALDELERYVVRDKRKIRTVEYKDNTAIGKPTKEVTDEKESVRVEMGPVDRQGLSQVTSALRNIKELYAFPADMDRNRYRAEYERRRAEVKDDSGMEILQNMQTIAELLLNPAANRKIEDFEEDADE